MICDLAQTYHVYDYKALPVPLLVTLFCGLGPDSRIARKAAGLPVSLSLLVHAAILDKLASLVHVYEKKGSPEPRSLLAVLMGVDKGADKGMNADAVKAESFDSVADYEAARRALLEGVTNNAGG